jgi:parallel beta-helix repeat protein
VYLPDRSIDIVGESQGGVTIYNNPGQNVFVLHNMSKTYNFRDFTMISQNGQNFSYMIYVYGDSASQNKSRVTIGNVSFVLKDDDSSTDPHGDSGIYSNYGDEGQIAVIGCSFTGGCYPVFCQNYTGVLVEKNTVNDPIYGIYVNISSKVSVIENTISNLRVSGIIVANSGQENNFSRNKIYGKNDARNIATYGIILYSVTNSKINDNIIRLETGRLESKVEAIYTLNMDHSTFSSNNIYISVDTTSWIYAMRLFSASNCVVSNNVIYVDDSDITAGHYGIGITASRNVISGNNINMINNNPNDHGIYLSAASQNNQGSDNIAYNCGVSVEDLGTDNDVTSKIASDLAWELGIVWEDGTRWDY